MFLLTIKVKQYACVENKNITSMTMSLADKLKGWKHMLSHKRKVKYIRDKLKVKQYLDNKT